LRAKRAELGKIDAQLNWSFIEVRMQEINQLEIGTTLNNDQLCDIFKCSPQGGMRRSKKTNSLVIVSNHVESIYDDRWLKNILHYTGMGQKGDQRLDYAQNKTLAESDRNGVAVYLF
jgi:5-methylcytosine-specific restriction protein A